MDNVNVVESIKKLCKENNITLSQLEKKIGLSQGLVSKWMYKTPSLDKIIGIADYFHVSLDEVVGYNKTDDIFLEKLITQTRRETIKWNIYTNDTKKQPRQYRDPELETLKSIGENKVNEYLNTYKIKSYFVELDNGYVLLWGKFKTHNYILPSNIKLFIQPDDDSQLIEQDYSSQQLRDLWIGVHYSLHEMTDEIKAEELKKSFVNQHKDKVTKQLHEYNESSVAPSLMKLFETYNTEEFQKLRQVFSDPEFQAAIQAASKMQEYFNNIEQ